MLYSLSPPRPSPPADSSPPATRGLLGALSATVLTEGLLQRLVFVALRLSSRRYLSHSDCHHVAICRTQSSRRYFVFRKKKSDLRLHIFRRRIISGRQIKCCKHLRSLHVYHVVIYVSGNLTLRRLMSYIYMEHPFLMFLGHTQRRSTVGRTPLDE